MNKIANGAYEPLYDEECSLMTLNDIQQKEESAKQECIQMCGEQIKHNKKSLFTNKQWTPSSK